MKNKLVQLKKLAYAKYSNFSVAAIVVTTDKKLISGVNVENAVYSLGICAERNALASAYAKGYRAKDLSEIHILGSKKNRFISPCGACRQVILELMGPTAKIIMYHDSTKNLTKTALAIELLKEPFSVEDLS